MTAAEEHIAKKLKKSRCGEIFVCGCIQFGQVSVVTTVNENEDKLSIKCLSVPAKVSNNGDHLSTTRHSYHTWARSYLIQGDGDIHVRGFVFGKPNHETILSSRDNIADNPACGRFISIGELQNNVYASTADTGQVFCWDINRKESVSESGHLVDAGEASSLSKQHPLLATTDKHLLLWSKDSADVTQMCPGDGVTCKRVQFVPEPQSVTVMSPAGRPASGLTSTMTVTEVGCGKEHALILTNTGLVYALGSGSRGQLGCGDISKMPVSYTAANMVEALLGLTVTNVATGGWHSMAVSDVGDVYTWGWNESGQLGIPHPDSTAAAGSGEEVHVSYIPVLLDIHLPATPADQTPQQNMADTAAHIVKVSAGSRHSMALTMSGIALTWGSNKYGQLGDGVREAVGRFQPRPVTHFTDLQVKVTGIKAGPWLSYFYT